MEEDSALAAFDITFTDPATGEEVDPQDGNVVDVSLQRQEQLRLAGRPGGYPAGVSH